MHVYKLHDNSMVVEAAVGSLLQEVNLVCLRCMWKCMWSFSLL